MTFNDAYMLHLKKHIGRYHNIKSLYDKHHINIEYATDHIKYKNGQQLTNCSVEKGTIANNKGMLSILKQYQKKKNKSDFLIIFEDDIIPHKDFDEYYDKVIKYLETQKWKLFYFGASSRVTYSDLDKLDDFKIITNKISCSGAYGVAIHGSVVDLLIDIVKDNKDKPFDVYGLKTVFDKYPDKTLSIHPPLVITDVSSSSIRGYRDQEKFNKFLKWDRSLYVKNKSIPLVIISNGNLHRLDNILELVSTLKPVIEPVIIHTSNIRKYKKYYKNGISVMSVSDTSEVLNMLKQLKYDFYGIITDNINWKQPLPDNFFDVIFNEDNYDCQARLFDCSICHDNSIELKSSFDKLFMFTKDITKKSSKTITLPGEYYDVSSCIKYNKRHTFHTLTRYEIKKYLENGVNVFVIFERWIKDYLLNAKEKFTNKPSKTLLRMLYLDIKDKELYFTLTSVAMIFGTHTKKIIQEKYGELWSIKIKI